MNPLNPSSVSNTAASFLAPSATSRLSQLATSCLGQVQAAFSSCYRGTSLLSRSISKLPQLLAAPFIVAAYKCDSLIHKREEPLLIRAVTEANILLLNALYLMGADLNAVDQNNSTPFELAKQNNCLSVMEFLAQKNADLTPLFDSLSVDERKNLARSAAKNGLMNLLNGLEKKDSSLLVNNRNTNWNTLAHLAAMHGRLEVLQLLESKQVDLNTANIDGKTPLQLAQAQGHQKIIDFLGNLPK